MFAFSMCVFNWRYSKHKILIASSQKLNYVIIVGAFLGYLNVIAYTLLSVGFKIAFLCYFFDYSLSINFSLIYGTLFARAWRIYRIFHNPWSKKRPLKDGHLILIVLLAVFIDLVILVSSSLVDPYEIILFLTGIDYDSFSIFVSVVCTQEDPATWISVLFFYKLCFICCGVYIISLVRREVHVRKIYDDSCSLAVAISITAVSYVVGVFVLSVLSSVYSDLEYIGLVIFVNVSVSGTLICVFIPKCYKIVVKKDSGDMQLL